MIIKKTQDTIRIIVNEKYIEIAKIALIVSGIFWGTALVYNFIFILMVMLVTKL